jgi:PIN domain nuclease of toxin-antitoxin system
MILLDTHAWLWLTSDPDRLGEAARKAIRNERSRSIAAISCWEVAMLAARGRIELDRDPVSWMEDSLRAEDIELLPLTPAVAVASAQLEPFHGDPADRLIVATALAHGAPLVTKDENIKASGIVKTVWNR